MRRSALRDPERWGSLGLATDRGSDATRTGDLSVWGETTSRKQQTSTRWNRALSITAKIAGVTGATVLLVVGLLYARLLAGPISLTFLASHIQEALEREFAGLGVLIEDVSARLTDAGTVSFELSNIRVVDEGGAPLAYAPSASLSLSRKALNAGRLAPETIDLISPRLLLYYSEDGSLSVKFTPPGETHDDSGANSPALRGSTKGVAAPKAEAADWTQSRFDLVRTLSEASARARRREHAGAYLRGVGLRSATVILDNGSRKSIWRVRDLDIDLDHRRSRSSIAGRARIESPSGPWEVNFRTTEAANANSLQLNLSVQNLVPHALARSVPQFAMLDGVDVPVWAEAQLEVSNAGQVLSGTIGIDTAPGKVSMPWLGGRPVPVDGGHLALSYDGSARRFEIAPSVLVWGDSRVQFTGQITHTAQGAEGPRWVYDIRSAGGWLGADPPIHQRITIDDWRARGFLAPERGRVALNQFVLRAGGGEVSAQGDIADMTGAMQARLDGKISPMSADTFKALWPSILAPKSREWVGRHLLRGNLQGGTFRVASGGSVSGTDWTPGAPQRVSLAIEGSDLAVSVLDGWPTLEVPRGLLRQEGNTLEITAPDAAMTAADGRRIALKGGSLNIDISQPLPRTGHFAFKAQGPLSLALEMVDQDPINALQGSSASLAGIDGKVDAQLTLSMPLGEVPKAGEVKVEGKARITEGRLKQAVGPHDVTGANVAVDLTGTAIEAKGEMLINGVLAKANWQHVFGATPDKQPPLRILASLDNSDRTQLGFELNELVQGEVGLEVLVSHNANNERSVQVRTDLVNAEVFLDSVAWRKPKGRPSIFQFDVIKGTGQLPTELHNVKLVGDNVAVEGWMGIGPDHKLREFRFPQFSLNVIGSLNVTGRLRPDHVWEVTAKGTTYDGRDIFRSFFDVGRAQEQPDKNKPGLDLRADIDTVVGFSDTSMRDVRLQLRKRGNKMVGLEVRGKLEGGKPFNAVLRGEGNEARVLRADAADAGLLFKVVGFYPNAFGGQMNLEVNLDGQGPADRNGTLWARDFYVLGDPILSEVLQNADNTPNSSQGKRGRTVVREKFDFDTMRIPFSIGHGQFVMNGASIKGPLVGATLRGKVDFRSQRIEVGGTYVPLSGLNSALAPIPLLGPVLTGLGGEGIFGITFAIQGSLASPQVIVNPFALVTPGIFREIMQLTPDDPRVVPREKAPARNDPGAARSSSSAAKGPGGGSTGAGPDIGAGWSAEASDGRTKNK
jgi:hypothetical protein